MLALYRAGRQADALEAYRAARSALVEGLGIEPGPRLQELARAVLAQDASLDARRAGPPTRRSRPRAESARARRQLGRGRRPVTLSVVDEIPIDGEIAGFAVGEGSVWVGDREGTTLVRIDPSSRQVEARIRLGAMPRDVAAGLGSVWVLNQAATAVLRVDPVENAVVARAAVRGRASPAAEGAPNIAIGGGAVWVAHGGSVSRFEPATARQTTIRAGSFHLVAYGNDSLWIASGPTGDVGSRPAAVAFGEGAMWVAGVDGTLLRVDLASDRIVRWIRMPVLLTGPDWSATGTIAVGEGAVWVATE